jgi:AraC-like DNA-binding protein
MSAKRVACHPFAKKYDTDLIMVSLHPTARNSFIQQRRSIDPSPHAIPIKNVNCIDDLSSILRGLSASCISRSVFTVNGIEAALPMPDESWLFYGVLSGELSLELSSGETVHLQSGDIFLAVDGTMVRSLNGTSRIVSGVFRVERFGSIALSNCLPHYICARSSNGATPEWLVHLTGFINMISTEGPGFAALGDRLSEIFLIQIIRIHFDHMPQTSHGLRSAKASDALGTLIREMQMQPERDWTVQAMASRACLSRSAFIENFVALMGEAPGRYLKQLRLEAAASLIRNSTLPFGQIAYRCGFKSDATFSRAFRRFAGMSPGTYRQHAHSDAAFESVRSAN